MRSILAQSGESVSVSLGVDAVAAASTYLLTYERRCCADNQLQLPLRFDLFVSSYSFRSAFENKYSKNNMIKTISGQYDVE